MKTNLRQIFLLLAAIIFAPSSTYGKGNAYEEYIAKYAGLAREHMRKYDIPASITLAQGLLESGAGRSTLAIEANNHFGIKCHSDWKGGRIIRSDDRPDDCFRRYDSPEESFTDHSLFLHRKRYAPLFELDINDYVGWARTLKQCGYATDPNYAARLISIIELYSLYNFDGDRMKEISETADFIHNTLRQKHAIRRSRGLHYVIAQPGDTYAHIAKELKISKKKLLKYNDVSRDGEIKAWEEVYLQEKHPEAATAAEATATIGEGESIHSISQRFGIKLESLKALNPDVQDSPGEVLRLR